MYRPWSRITAPRENEPLWVEQSRNQSTNKAWAAEYGPKGVRANAVSLGPKQGHRCLTVQEAGWSGKQGELLAAAEPEFDVLITVDTNIRYQQNLEGHSIAHRDPHSSNRLEHVRQHFPPAVCLEKIKPGEIVRVGGTV